MSFDWSQESRERYFQKAEEMIGKIEAADIKEMLHVDRSQFGVIGKSKVKIFLKIICKKGNVKRWQRAKKLIPELREFSEPLTKYGKKGKQFFIRGYMEIELEARDK